MIDNEKDVKKPENDSEIKERKEESPEMFRYEKESGVQYCKPGQAKPKRFKTYWRKLMDSTQRKMSRGSAKIARMFSWARCDNWRRGGEGNREHRKPGKK